jgi:hypothetical protein
MAFFISVAIKINKWGVGVEKKSQGNPVEIARGKKNIVGILWY